MAKSITRKIPTDIDVKRKAVKLVIAHLKRKIPKDYTGPDLINNWISEMDKVMDKPEFNMSDYIEMRRELNDIIERTLDEELRYKLRDSWYSMGKALDKKAKRR